MNGYKKCHLNSHPCFTGGTLLPMVNSYALVDDVQRKKVTPTEGVDSNKLVKRTYVMTRLSGYDGVGNRWYFFLILRLV